MIYLACPYSHESRAVRQFRFEAANKVAGVLMRRGLGVFSPLSHSHPIVAAGGPDDHDLWMGHCAAMLFHCRSIYVLQLDGWKESRGVQAEIGLADDLGLRLTFVHPHDFGLPLTLVDDADFDDQPTQEFDCSELDVA